MVVQRMKVVCTANRGRANRGSVCDGSAQVEGSVCREQR